MKFTLLKYQLRTPSHVHRQGFSLMEVVVAMGIIGVVFMALYSGLTYGFQQIQFSRENLRATQILMEKMETIRLYNWDQIRDNSFIPSTFTETYCPAGADSSAGVAYSGSLLIWPPPLGTNYDDNMRVVLVRLYWYTGKVRRTRTMHTFVSQNGLYNYISQ